MKAITYTQPTLFYDAIEPFLAGQEAFNNLPLGISKKFTAIYPNGQEADSETFRMILLEEEGKVVGMACQELPRFLLFAFGEGNFQEKADLMVSTLRQNEWEIPGVVGERKAAHTLAQTYANGKYDISAEHLCYELKEVIPPRPASGKGRIIDIQSSELVLNWVEAFYDEVIPEAERDMPPDEALTLGRIEKGKVWFWEDPDPVCMAIETRTLPHGACVSYVYTPPNARRKGYASNLVATMSSHILDRGMDYAALFTDAKNPTSNKIYQDVGYNFIGENALLTF